MKSFDLQTLHAELNRVSDWIKFSDKKTASLSAYYTIALGFVVARKNDISIYFTYPCDIVNLLWALVFIGVGFFFLFGVFYLFKSMFPSLNNAVTSDSLFYFGHVANMKYVDYCKKMKAIDEDEIKTQIAEQIHENSIIAKSKMESVKKSGVSIFIVAILLGLFAVLS